MATTRDWKVRFYQKTKEVMSTIIKDRTEHEAEKEAMSNAPERYDDWSMMPILTLEEITALQEQYGLTEMQTRINSGLCWTLEGSYGRTAMSTLESGACMLPEVPRRDYWGSIVPARTSLKSGTKVTLEHSQNFWQKVEDGEIILNEDVEEEVE
jgi:hypothetical protein